MVKDILLHWQKVRHEPDMQDIAGETGTNS